MGTKREIFSFILLQHVPAARGVKFPCGPWGMIADTYREVFDDSLVRICIHALLPACWPLHEQFPKRLRCTVGISPSLLVYQRSANS